MDIDIDDIKGLKRILEADIKKSSNVFIIGHNSPDFDSIGSCIGLSMIAKTFKKPTYIIVNDEDAKIEPGVKKIIDDNKEDFNIIKNNEFLNKKNNNSLLIVTDVNKDYMVSVKDYLEDINNIIVIDHHMKDEKTIKNSKKFISLNSSSACEIVTRLLGYFRIKYSTEIANYLLAGISLDTKRFKHNTTAKTHDVAEKLIDHGADIDYVNKLFLEEFESYCKISNLIINGTIIKKYSENLLSPIQVSFTLNRNQPKAIYLKEDYAKAADRMMKFNGIDAAFTLGYVDEKTIHISARSGKRVDVGKIMEEVYGGGNAQNAGGRVESDNIFEIEEELMNKVYLGISDKEDIIDEPPVIKIKQIKRK